MLSAQTLKYAIVFYLFLDALVKEVLDHIAKPLPKIVSNRINRPNRRSAVRSLVHIPKIKAQTQKKSYRFSVTNAFNYLAAENCLPKSVNKIKFFF